MNIQKVERFIELQERVNWEIDVYGEAILSDCDMLMEVGDSLTGKEIQKVVELVASRSIRSSIFFYAARPVLHN